MSSPARFLSPSEAARRIGVSVKALRIYERHGLLAPFRSANGWRTYGPDQVVRAEQAAALRALGLSLAEIARAFGGLQTAALADHQALLEGRLIELTLTLERVRQHRAGLGPRQYEGLGLDPAMSRPPASGVDISFKLPWPWAGETFELRDIRRLNFLTGPLGCGKTRLALKLAETLPGGAFLDLDRGADAGAAARSRLTQTPDLKSRVDKSLEDIVAGGGVASDALISLLVGMASDAPAFLVVDMVEQGLDSATQVSLIAHVRKTVLSTRPLFLMTRSTAILNLEDVSEHEAIIFCPANHAPPLLVDPHPGSVGYEAAALCLAAPEVRARTEGMRAWMPLTHA